MEDMFKYPRTRHIEGSRLQAGDEDLKSVPFREIAGRFVVLEEKVDGANCGISFGNEGQLLLQSRGHYLNGGYGERQFDLFKKWANSFSFELFQLLGKRYIMYGEWLYAKHTVYYDRLPHYFMEFDLFDKVNRVFLSTQRRRELLLEYPFLTSVLVLYEGKLKQQKDLTCWMGNSHFKSEDFLQSLERQCRELGLSIEQAKQQTDQTMLMEGIYIKVEEDGIVTDRMKYVRSSFLNTILDSETHWIDRPLIPNQLKTGGDLFCREAGK